MNPPFVRNILYVLNDAQAYYRKATMRGGGGQSFDGSSGNSVTVDGTGAVSNVSLSATATITSSGMNITWSN